MPAKLDLLKSLSLKRRLFFASFLWVSSMLLAAGVGIPTLVKEYLVSDIKGQLQLAMDEIAANLEANAQGNLLLPARLSDPVSVSPTVGSIGTRHWVSKLYDPVHCGTETSKPKQHHLVSVSLVPRKRT